MSMPPSGVEGLMEDEAVIEAQIQLELENINLDNDVPQDDVGDENADDNADLELQEGDIIDVPHELDTYIKAIQDQTNRFEQELLECDTILNYSSATEDQNLALIPYEDQTLLVQLAKERGCTVDDYKKQILEEIENDEVVIEDELAELIEDNNSVAERSENAVNSDLKAITENGETTEDVINNASGKMEVDVKRALEEGIKPDEVPVSQELVPFSGHKNGQTPQSAEIQKLLRQQLERLEVKYQERIEKIKKDEAYRRDAEEVRQRRLEEERLWKRQEIERESQSLAIQRQAAEDKINKQNEETMQEMQQSKKKFEEDMALLQAETEKQRREHELAVKEERQRQADRQQRAAVCIQSRFRAYRVRKEVGPTLSEMKETRRKQKEEERIKEVEIEIEKRKEEQQKLEEQKRAKEEEERKKEEERKRLKEEERQRKEMEKKQKEEEKRRLKEEEKRQKMEEKQRKEEEKQRKKEEEKRKKEEEIKRKEREEQIKKEEKRLREEEEKRRREELKCQKENEKKRIEEEEKQKREDAKRREEDEKRKRKEEELAAEVKPGEKEPNSCSETVNERLNGDAEGKGNNVLMGNSINDSRYKQEHANAMTVASLDAAQTDASKATAAFTSDATIVQDVDNLQQRPASDKVNTKDESVSKSAVIAGEGKVKPKPQTDTTKQKTPRAKTPRSARKPHQPTPTQQPVGASASSDTGASKELEKEENTDSLPEALEKLRLQFIKDCLPWSKVANEPWKLKTGVSKKPLRRPSSAKKLPLLSESVIVQAGRVASLKQVTTVQLSDLPGNNISSLGQCWGLKYLSLTSCNLMAVDGLGQCKQLQYLDVKNNKIEYLDVKDIGQLQYLNASHNRLSSIHGLDNCTNLRWLDMSHNNITRLGGLETLRRLCTLKLSHNQLITTQGLGDLPTVQMLDLSHNHLQTLEDVNKLCLLASLDMSSNNLLQVPKLTNQVLLQELLLSDNSISSLEEVASTWLPLLNKLVLYQNSIDELPVLENCLLLKELDLKNNQIQDADKLHRCVEKCAYLESLNIQENPVTADLQESFYERLCIACPRLQNNDRSFSSPEPIKPRTSFETMCLTQCHTIRDIITHFNSSLKSDVSRSNSPDLAQLCDVHFKFCDKLFNTLVEFRYAHEYGEVSITVPTAPKTPKSGRPQSARHKDKFLSPKDLFENALKASPQTITGKAGHGSLESNVTEPTEVLSHNASNPKDLFEDALRSAGNSVTKQNACSKSKTQPEASVNGYILQKDEFLCSKNSNAIAAATLIQAHWRGWLVRHEIAEQTRIWLAATTIQAAWRGYRVRQITGPEISRRRQAVHVDPGVMEELHAAATKIQATWRGYILRKKLLAALEYAQYDWSDEEDQDAMNLNDEFDVDKFLDFSENQLDSGWMPPETPDIPASHPVLKKPPSGKARIPPINVEPHPPSNPRRAWKNLESPLSDYERVPRPPSSLASTNITARTGMSKKEEKLSEEWGFKDSNTAHLMMQRAKKMKYNAEKRKKLSKLDPKQRLALFRKLEEVTHPSTVHVPQRKTLPRKEYFQARQDEINRQEQEKREEFHTRVSRTFEWLHTQVGDHPVSDSIINQNGPRYVADRNLPELQGGCRVQLVSTPGSLELQSVGSASSAGHKARRFSVGSGGPASKLPPIPQTTSAPTQHVKERMSFRNPKVNHDVGWGGGRKRTNKF